MFPNAVMTQPDTWNDVLARDDGRARRARLVAQSAVGGMLGVVSRVDSCGQQWSSAAKRRRSDKSECGTRAREVEAKRGTGSGS